MSGRFVSLSIAVSLAVSPAFGQATGTITGTVRDSSGAVLAGAGVTARNILTNQTRTVTAGHAGEYALPLLPVGSYTVRMEMRGFTPFEQTNLVLQANTAIQVDGVLNVGATTEQITVSATPTLVQAGTSNLVQVVETRRIEDLPLDGRNVLDLMSLGAGINDENATAATIQTNSFGKGAYHVGVSANGSRPGQINFLLDNADHNDSYSEIALPYPNPDAVQEFSLQTSSFDAQYGRSVGGVVNVVTRSGTNQFHGTAYNYTRNSILNATNFFSRQRDNLKRNQFGATLGGPVIRDKTFFFASYQGTRRRLSTPGAQSTALTEAMKQGDLSAWLTADGRGRIRDPLSNVFFPNNRIPVSRFDPVAVNLMQYIPVATEPGYLRRYGSPPMITNDNQVTARLDQQLSAGQRLSFRYFMMDFDLLWRWLPGDLTTVSPGQLANAHNFTGNYVRILNARLLNELTVGGNHQLVRVLPPDELNLPFEKFGADIRSYPGQPTMEAAITGWYSLSIGLPSYAVQSTVQIADNLSYSNGRHNLRFGGDLRYFNKPFRSTYRSGGAATFNGLMLSEPGRSNAGNSWGEFLLGMTSNFIQSSISAWEVTFRRVSLYVQEDYRVSPRLTVNLGLRWDPRGDLDEPNGKQMTFVPGARSKRFPNAPAGLQFLGDPGFEDSIFATDWNNFAPRAGFAWQAARRMVVRGAYGVFYTELAAINNNRAAQGEPFVRQANITGSRNPISRIYGDDSPLDPNPMLPGPDFVFRPYGTWALPSRDLRSGYMQNWNFIVERQVRANSVLRLGYVGSKGTSLLAAQEVNYPLFGPGATASNIDQRRIYQPLGALQLGINAGFSTYHSMQATAQKRFSRGYSVLVNFTWAKSIDNLAYSNANANSFPDPMDRNKNRGPSDFDVTRRMVASGIVEHSKFKGLPPVWRTVLGGWQSNFIFTAFTGLPITIRSGANNSYNGAGMDFADLTGLDWRLPADRSKQDKMRQWFDKAAFRTSAVGTVGTGRRNQLRAPGRWNVNYSLFKTFPVNDRIKIQFRGELFNVFNHPNLGAPTASVNSANFGRITSVTAERIGQLALRIRF